MAVTTEAPWPGRSMLTQQHVSDSAAATCSQSAEHPKKPCRSSTVGPCKGACTPTEAPPLLLLDWPMLQLSWSVTTTLKLYVPHRVVTTFWHVVLEAAVGLLGAPCHPFGALPAKVAAAATRGRPMYCWPCTAQQTAYDTGQLNLTAAQCMSLHPSSSSNPDSSRVQCSSRQRA